MKNSQLNFEFSSPVLTIRAELLSWDAKAFGANVATISTLESSGGGDTIKGFPPEFWEWAHRKRVKLVSRRVPGMSFTETKLLESEGFNFVEVALHPHLKNVSLFKGATNGFLAIPIDSHEVSKLSEMAFGAFSYERFHADPRIHNAAASMRYKNWVNNLEAFSDQNALKILDPAGGTAGFFIYTLSENGNVNWLLTALGETHRGRGFGKNAWASAIEFHKKENHKSIVTTITARNSPVLRLYGQLGFSYLTPEATFHWVSPEANLPVGL